MKNSIWIIFVLTILVQSCSCNYHLKRIQSKCENLIKTDTTYITVRDSIPEIKATGTLSIAKQDSALLLKIDSLLSIASSSVLNKENCDSVISALKAKIHVIVRNRPVIPDTATIYTHGGYIKAWVGKSGFQFEVNIPKQYFEKKIPCVTVTNNYSPKKNWWPIALIVIGIAVILLTVKSLLK